MVDRKEVDHISIRFGNYRKEESIIKLCIALWKFLKSLTVNSHYRGSDNALVHDGCIRTGMIDSACVGPSLSRSQWREHQVADESRVTGGTGYSCYIHSSGLWSYKLAVRVKPFYIESCTKGLILLPHSYACQSVAVASQYCSIGRQIKWKCSLWGHKNILYKSNPLLLSA